MMSQSVDTKEKLIDASIKIFAKRGFWKAKVSDIVNEAGVAQGTFYLYFKSKEDCLKNVLLILHNETINEMLKMIDQKYSLSEIVIFFIKRVIKFKNISKVFLFEALSSGDEFKELYFKFKRNFREIFKKFSLSEEINSIIFGTLREIIEQDIIYENKDEDKVLLKVKNIMNFLNIP